MRSSVRGALPQGHSSTPPDKKDSHLRYLLTGGAGFIGSHLSDALIARGDEVVILDDLSTGRVGEHRAPARSRTGRVRRGLGNRRGARPRAACSRADACFHLASAVGVQLVVEQPVDSLLRNVRGTDIVLSAAAALDRPAAVHLDLGGLRQEQQRRAARGLRPHPRLAAQVALELRDREGLRRGARARLPPRARREERRRAALQHRRARARPGPTGWSCRASSARR